MGFAVYVGPFAEWVVPEGFHDDRGEQFDRVVEWIEEQNPSLDSSAAELRVRVKGRLHIHSCWTAHFAGSRPKPPRHLQWHADKDDLHLLDLSGVDMAGEVAWFHDTFGTLLDRLAEYFGERPALKWGVVPLRY